MIHVLHYVYKMSIGGIETLIMNLYRNINREEIQFNFAVHTKEVGDYDKEINELGGKIIHFPSTRKNLFQYLKIWNDFWQYNASYYKAFHFHTPTLANIYPLIKASKYKVPIRIVHSHNTYANKGRLQQVHDIAHRYNSRRITKFANKFFACSKPAAAWLFGKDYTDSLNVKIFKNGIDTKLFNFNKKTRNIYRSKLGLENKIVIGHVGRFVKQKNHDLLIDIFSKLYNKNKKLVLLMIGEGELVINIRNKVAQLGINDAVKFIGIRKDIHNLLMAMDLILFPSLHEGLGIVLVEAQASSLPVLASNKIPLEIKCTDNFQFKDINESVESWAEEALRMIKKGDRKSQISKIKEAGYDITSVTKKYENFLLSYKYDD